MNNASAKKDRVVWCDRGWMPYSYGFCPNKKAWDREMDRLEIEPRPAYPINAKNNTDACCMHFENAKEHNACTIVCISADLKRGPAKIGMLVHEGMHVWRAMREAIGETQPSSEFEAYSMQAIAQSLVEAFEVSRGRLCQRKVR